MPTRSIILTDSVLLAILKRQDIMDSFPFLRQAKSRVPATKGCGKCGSRKRSNAQRAKALASIKNQIIMMSGSLQSRLKSKIGVDKITVFLPTAPGSKPRRVQI